MAEYALFIRGINVGKTKRVKVQDISSMLSASFGNVRSYGQSGNFVFSTDIQRKDISPMIESKFEERFGFGASCLLRTKEELSAVLDDIPFKDAPKDHLYFIFIDREIPHGRTEWENNGDLAKRSGSIIYLNCMGEYHKTKLSNNFFEKELGAVCTARNWNTVENVLKLQ